MLEPALLWAVVPVNSFRSAKRRMAPLLGSAERERLARAMFQDVLAAALAARSLAGVMVVTPDEEVAALAAAASATVLQESAAAGTNAAVSAAIQALRAAPSGGMIVLPSDVPQVTGAVLEEIASLCRAPRSLVLARAARDGGTNCLGASPADLIETGFGPNSFARHQATAARAGVAAQVPSLGRLDLDLDVPDDLAAFVSLRSATRTHRLLVNLGFGGPCETPMSTGKRQPVGAEA